MREISKNYIVAIMLIVSSLMVCASAQAATMFKGNWTETFKLGWGHYVKHTPQNVNFDGMLIIGDGIEMECLTINNVRFENVELLTDSTRAEFVAAIGRMKVTKL